MSWLHPEHLRMGFEAVIRPRAVMVGLPQTGQTARHRRPRREPDEGSTSRICQPETVVPVYFFFGGDEGGFGTPLPCTAGGTVGAGGAAGAGALQQTAAVDVLYTAAITSAREVTGAGRGRGKDSPVPEAVSGRNFGHSSHLTGAGSAQPAKSGHTPGTHAFRRTSPARCAAGCPPALQKRSATGQYRPPSLA